MIELNYSDYLNNILLASIAFSTLIIMIFTSENRKFQSKLANYVLISSFVLSTITSMLSLVEFRSLIDNNKYTPYLAGGIFMFSLILFLASGIIEFVNLKLRR